MKIIKNILYQFYKWLIFLPIAIIDSILGSILAGSLSIIFNPKVGSKAGALWARIIAIFTLMKVKVHGRENLDKNKSYVIVSNHQSAYDIFALYGYLNVDFRWIMKMELRKLFFIGWACEKVGHIFIDRSSPKNALKSINQAKAKLINGTSVLVFPEGTRSGSNKVRNFKSGAFKIAEDLELPIIPITLRNTCKIYKGDGFNIKPGTVDIFIGEEINTAQYHGNARELMKVTREKIIEPIKEFNN